MLIDTLGGARSYFSATVEIGWLAYPLPAIYRGPEKVEYRAWLPEGAWEADFQLGGSVQPDEIEDYYTTPYDFGLDRVVKFDHDFIGRDALEKLKDAPPRTKVALEWRNEDIAKLMNSQFGDGPVYKAMELPSMDYTQIHRDMLRTPDGRMVGLSTHGNYNINEKVAISFGIVDREVAKPGTELLLTWGEAGGGSRKPEVEGREQTTIRVMVHEVPFSKAARDLKYQTVSSALADASAG